MFKNIFCVILICLSSTILAATIKVTELNAMLPETVASIDGKKISKAEFVKYFVKSMPYGKIPKAMDKERATYTIPNILKQMVYEKLIDNLVQEKKIPVNAKELESYYRERLKTLSPNELAILKRRNKNIDNWIKKQTKNEDNLKTYARYKFTKQEFLDKAQANASDVQKYYNSNVVRFKCPETVDLGLIICAYNPKKKGDKEATKKRIDAIAQELKKAPQNFEALAKKHSNCYSKKDGGRIGVLARNMLNKKLDNAAFALKAGGISDIIDVSNSYNIIKCYAKSPERKYSFQEVKPQIEVMYKAKAAEAALSKFLEAESKRRKVEFLVKMPPYKEPVFKEPVDVKK